MTVVKNGGITLVAQRKYITSVYFHALFLYIIIKNRNFQIQRVDESNNEAELVEIEDYLKDIFQSYYADFLLNFSMEPLIQALEE